MKYLLVVLLFSANLYAQNLDDFDFENFDNFDEIYDAPDRARSHNDFEHELDTRYSKSEIAKARFGSDDAAEINKLATNFDKIASESIYGQDDAIRVFKAKLLEYLKTYKTRTGSPVNLNMMGLYGVGKSQIVDILEDIGIEVMTIDAGQHVTDHIFSGTMYGEEVYENATSDNMKPLAIFVDELDEIAQYDYSYDGKTVGKMKLPQPGISEIGQILNNGLLKSEGQIGVIPFENVFFITALNFSNLTIEEFFKSNKKYKNKDIFELTDEDFEAFHKWATKEGQKEKILSKLYHNKFVGRSAPNTIIFKPLKDEHRLKVIDKNIHLAIMEFTKVNNNQSQLEISYSKKYKKFLNKQLNRPYTGARLSNKAKNLTSQILEKAQSLVIKNKQITAVRPKVVHLDFDKKKNKTKFTVTEKIYNQKSKKWTLGESQDFHVDFDKGSNTFIFDKSIELADVSESDFTHHYVNKKNKITKKIIKESRFPKLDPKYKGLRKNINNIIFGQEKIIEIITDKFIRFSAERQLPIKPYFHTLAGFTGVGKSAILQELATQANAELVSINLQEYISNDSIKDFFKDLNGQLTKAQEEADKTGSKVIVLLEEFDKVAELNPEDGSRTGLALPAMIKELTNTGKITKKIDDKLYKLDLRNTFNAITMNFGVDMFKFKPDPRLTSVEQMESVHKAISKSYSSISEVLSQLFLPETVARLISNFSFARPLNKESFEKIIKKTVANTIQSSYPKNGLHKLSFKISKNYYNYLYNEFAIPSLGGRFTNEEVRGTISQDIASAVSSIPKNSEHAAADIEITIDHRNKSARKPARMIYTLRAIDKQENKKKYISTSERVVGLNFPPLFKKSGFTKENLHTAAHEFGHAFLSVRLGMRFDYLVGVSLIPGTGGHLDVKTKNTNGPEILADLVLSIGSTVFEKMVMMEDPNQKQSNFFISPGPNGDRQMFTELLYDLIYTDGMNSKHVLNYQNDFMNKKFPVFGELPESEREKLNSIGSALIKKVEEDIFAAHSFEWYKDKFIKIAQNGVVEEEKFYKIIGYKYPGLNEKGKKDAFTYFDKMEETFKDVLKKETKQLQSARLTKHGDTKKNVLDNYNEYIDFFVNQLEIHYGSDSKSNCPELLGKITK